MIERARELLPLNRYNPRVVYTLIPEMDKLIEYTKTHDCNSREVSQLYEELKLKRLPIYNDIYKNLFGKFCETQEVDTISILRKYKLDLVIYAVSLVEDLQKFCNDSVAQRKIAYNEKSCLTAIAQLALKFLELYENKHEDMWSYYYWMERMVIRGLRRNIVYKKDLSNILPLIQNINNYKKDIINSYYVDDDLSREVLLNSIELQEKYLESRESLLKYIEQKEKEYMNAYGDAGKDQYKIRRLYDNFVSEKQQYIDKPKSLEVELYIEYIECKLTHMPIECLYYHTPEEAFDCFRECSFFLAIFNRDIIKRTVINALLNDGEGLYKRYETTSYDTFVENNLQMLSKYGILSPMEYMELRKKILKN